MTSDHTRTAKGLGRILRPAISAVHAVLTLPGLRPWGEGSRPAAALEDRISAAAPQLRYQLKCNVQTLAVAGAEALAGKQPPALDGDMAMRQVDSVIKQILDACRHFGMHGGALEITTSIPSAYFRRSRSMATFTERVAGEPAFEGMLIELDSADVLANLGWTMALARELRPLRVGISISPTRDDWTGILKVSEPPFVEMKISREHLAGCDDNRAKQRLCQEILKLADGLGLRTTAADIETATDLAVVRDAGFDLIQGPFLGEPSDAHTFADMLGRSTSAEESARRLHFCG